MKTRPWGPVCPSQYGCDAPERLPKRNVVIFVSVDLFLWSSLISFIIAVSCARFFTLVHEMLISVLSSFFSVYPWVLKGEPSGLLVREAAKYRPSVYFLIKNIIDESNTLVHGTLDFFLDQRSSLTKLSWNDSSDLWQNALVYHEQCVCVFVSKTVEKDREPNEFQFGFYPLKRSFS